MGNSRGRTRRRSPHRSVIERARRPGPETTGSAVGSEHPTTPQAARALACDPGVPRTPRSSSAFRSKPLPSNRTGQMPADLFDRSRSVGVTEDGGGGLGGCVEEASCSSLGTPVFAASPVAGATDTGRSGAVQCPTRAAERIGCRQSAPRRPEASNPARSPGRPRKNGSGGTRMSQRARCQHECGRPAPIAY